MLTEGFVTFKKESILLNEIHRSHNFLSVLHWKCSVTMATDDIDNDFYLNFCLW